MAAPPLACPPVRVSAAICGEAHSQRASSAVSCACVQVSSPREGSVWLLSLSAESASTLCVPSDLPRANLRVKTKLLQGGLQSVPSSGPEASVQLLRLLKSDRRGLEPGGLVEQVAGAAPKPHCCPGSLWGEAGGDTVVNQGRGRRPRPPPPRTPEDSGVDSAVAAGTGHLNLRHLGRRKEAGLSVRQRADL